MLRIVSHPDYDAGFPADHRFPMSKYSALRSELLDRGLLRNDPALMPEPAPFDWLARAHDPLYVRQVIDAAVPRSIEREIGFPVCPRVSRRARLAAGGTVLAAKLALRHGVACNAAGGSHHARRAHGAGFCTFNDVAVAALRLLDEGLAGNILVLDLDVHQGDGTADILGGDPRVFTVSVHAEKNYPVRKVPSRLDIGLADRVGDADYLAVVGALLERLDEQGPFDLVFFNAGVDPHRDDKLGRLDLTDDGLRAREALVMGHFRERSIPLCGVIGGGYGADVAAIARRHAILFETAARLV
ncbi:MAG TPA: histone deacetylase [Mesorhizobium sp.]|jgi:acetoin utilization deacetylase AcuC-like enzyme|nr:histone deacetylase [Mesorhizobium sp.]